MNESPLKQFGGGGLSGAPLFPLLLDWLRRAKGYVHKPLIVVGGIMSKRDVQLIQEVKQEEGVRIEAIALGSIVMLRPWNIVEVVREARRIIR